MTVASDMRPTGAAMRRGGVIDPNTVPTSTFEWGVSKWIVTRDTVDANLSVGLSVLQPGKGHGRHNHPQSEEILYVASGRGTQMVNDEEPFPLYPGDFIHIPTGIYHATYSASWEPLRVIAIHNPGGAEGRLRDEPGFEYLPPGAFPAWTRA